MADRTGIEWTDATWNPVRGCTRVSPGCVNCYAERVAARFSREGLPYHGLAEMRGGQPRWTGALSFGHDMDAPLRWRRPKLVFVNSMSDLFLFDRAEVATVLAIAMAAHVLRGHVFQILTKRSSEMRVMLLDPGFWDQVNAEVSALVLDGTDPLHRRSDDVRATARDHGPGEPSPGVWIGVSIEDQRRADARRADLAALAAAGWTTFVSYEPALGRVGWTGWEFLSWMISGGENGPRPSHPDWHRVARDFCATHAIPYLFKQWGSWAPVIDRERDDPDWRADYGRTLANAGQHRWLNLDGGCGFHGERFHVMRRIGKKAAGRLLDGVRHNGMPEICRATFHHRAVEPA